MYGAPSLMAVTLFNYLGRMLSSSYYDWKEVEQNLQRDQGKWGKLVKLLGREVLDRITTGRFYVVVVQVVLLFGSKTWVMNTSLDKTLEDFHHRAVRRTAGV